MQEPSRNIRTKYTFFTSHPDLIQCCVHCCGLQMSHVSVSVQLLPLSSRIVSSQSSLLYRRPMFVLVSLFLVCLPVFLLLFSAEYHNQFTPGIVSTNVYWFWTKGLCKLKNFLKSELTIIWKWLPTLGRSRSHSIFLYIFLKIIPK